MRKAFSEVVAGSTAANSGFPPLQSNRQILLNSEKNVKQKSARDGGREKVNEISDEQVSEKVAVILAIHEVKNDIVSNDVTKDRSLPIYMNCPHCMELKSMNDPADVRFAGTISQLQRIILVTPHFPVILAASPVIQFEEACLPPSVPDCKKKLQFSLGCRVILPPESFLSIRLPFVHGVQLENGNVHPLMPFEDQSQLTAWITKGTTLQLVSKDSNHEELFTYFWTVLCHQLGNAISQKHGKRGESFLHLGEVIMLSLGRPGDSWFIMSGRCFGTFC
ncbi:hypothetical protein K7X08_031955 [Anisodus acutangulus]|uniref:Nonsense-mediated mRNA decay factor SMG8 n=1 Tax=Anisodus acutangulus TaxID=402998 RepID=A0A9Q1MMB8_9SOLA|nr:hypothetical protein K7X08_031955 [Anisodus acutangulus]